MSAQIKIEIGGKYREGRYKGGELVTVIEINSEAWGWYDDHQEGGWDSKGLVLFKYEDGREGWEPLEYARDNWTAEPREIATGDRVRSFDFPDRDRSLEGELACYAEGIVEGIGRFDFPDCDRYKIKVERHVFSGEALADEHVADYIYPPVNGTPKLFGGVCDGVEKIVG